MRKTRTVFAASIAALALLAASCGDDGGDETTSTTAAPAATGKTGTSGTGAATGSTGAASSCKLDKAPKIIGLAEKPPEGPNAIPDFANGWDLALTAKACTNPPDVVLVTGWGFQLEEEAAVSRGVDLVMAKPFSWEDVENALRVLSARRLRAA